MVSDISAPDGATPPPVRARARGIVVVLVAIYGILALAATGRSAVQILRNFDEAPVAYSLSALAAVVYILATVSLIARGPVWRRIAWITISFELVFVLVVGILSIVDAELFPRDTVWSYFGLGYLLFPLFTPVLGLIWLRATRSDAEVRP